MIRSRWYPRVDFRVNVHYILYHLSFVGVMRSLLIWIRQQKSLALQHETPLFPVARSTQLPCSPVVPIIALCLCSHM